MKVETKIGNVFMSEGMKVHKFRVKINRQSYKLLYGDLYSDPISAIIRELSTNAHDSHIKAGKPNAQFEVHLPNELEPFFYVKDFGTGLSPDQVYGEDGIYITFCDSNKVDSDEVTGCLGLGSKSPLAHTDNFTVTSNYNGMQYVYAVIVDGEGNPTLAEGGECPTNEPNGLKVELGIQQKDFDTFVGKAATILSWFKVKPNVVGHPDFRFDEHEYLRKTERYGVRKDNTCDSHVIMGNVAYPISSSDFNYNKIDDVERAVLGYGVDLFVDMGDVEFVPSREKLRYTEKTIVSVKKYLKDAIASIKEELEKQVLAQPTVWQARRMMNDIKHSILGKVRSLGTVDYNGVEIAEYINFHKTVQKTMPGIERANPLYPKFEILSKKKEQYRRHDDDTLHCNGTKIYLNDLERGGFARIHKNIRETDNSKSAYILTGVNAAFLEETGILEVAVKASTLPKSERQQRVGTDGNGARSYVKRTVLQEYTPSNGRYMTDWWHDAEVDVRQGGVYVVVSYGQITEGESKILPFEIKKKFLAVTALRPDFKLMGIRSAHIGRIERYKSRWIKFDDYADSLLKSEFPPLLDKINLMLQWSNVANKDRYERFFKEPFAPHSVYGQFVDRLREAKVVADDLKVKTVLALNDNVKNPCSLNGEITELSTIESTLKEVYPLMQHIEYTEWRRGSDFTNHFSEYVRCIDEQRHKAQPMLEAV